MVAVQLSAEVSSVVFAAFCFGFVLLAAAVAPFASPVAATLKYKTINI